MSTVYKIHPAIGIGRVGSSADYYLSPSQAGALPTVYSTPPAPGGPLFRDSEGNLLRQGVKFQVYAYDDTNPDDPGTPVVVGQGGVTGIKWTAWLASKKSSWFQFMQQTGSGMGPYQTSVPTTPPVSAADQTTAYAFGNDLGYTANNRLNPWNNNTNPPTNPNLPVNPLRYNIALGASPNPASMADPGRQQLILDPGPQSLDGPGQQADFAIPAASYPFLAGLQPFGITTLGSMQTGADSSLVMLPGFGNSGTTDTPPQITFYGNNNGWFDDIADGPVTAEVIVGPGSQSVEAVSGWFSVAPPKYAPEAVNMITLYDTMYDALVRERGYNPSLYSGSQFVAGYQPSFPDEVLPILSRPTVYQWFTDMPTNGRTAHANLLPTGSPTDPNYAAEVAQFQAMFAANAFPYVRGRGLQNGSPGPSENIPFLMPKLAGDNPITNFTISKFLGLTQTQFFILSQFAAGQYTIAPQTGLPPGASGPGPLLDRAQLENAVGGPFTPGIEITWISRNPTLYQPAAAGAPASDWFRVNATPLSSLAQGRLSLTNGVDNNYATHGLEPGDLTKYMAQPWQADFNECSNQTINVPIGPLGSPPTLNSPSVNDDQVTLWWWPVQRPWYVYPQAAPTASVPWTRDFLPPNPNVPDYVTTDNDGPPDLQMVTCWRYLGFIKKIEPPPAGNAPLFQEIERVTAPIQAYTNSHPDS